MNMKNYGSISKLSAMLNNPISYKFNIGDVSFDLNNCIGKTIKIPIGAKSYKNKPVKQTNKSVINFFMRNSLLSILYSTNL